MTALIWLFPYCYDDKIFMTHSLLPQFGGSSLMPIIASAREISPLHCEMTALLGLLVASLYSEMTALILFYFICKKRGVIIGK
jgi:hypothetical protein